MNWNDAFEYKDGCLYWRESGKGRKADRSFGCVCKKWGYVIGRFNQKTIRAHRVIWEIFNGEIPEGMQIDHINHIRHDNRVENLRLVSNQENCKNISMQKNNTSGVTGVCWSKQKGKWMAKIKVDYKTINLGLYSDIEKAVEARKKAEIKYSFHKNHGVNL